MVQRSRITKHAPLQMLLLPNAGFTAQDTRTFTVDTIAPVAAINTSEVAFCPPPPPPPL